MPRRASVPYRILPDDTPTRRRRVYINAVVGPDGRIRLEFPAGAELANVLRTFTVEFDEPLPDMPPDPEQEAFREAEALVHPKLPQTLYSWAC